MAHFGETSGRAAPGSWADTGPTCRNYISVTWYISNYEHGRHLPDLDKLKRLQTISMSRLITC